MDPRSIISGHTRPRSNFHTPRSLLRMTRSHADKRFKLRKLARKLKAHFKARPLSGSSFHTPPQDLRNAKSAYSLRPVRDLMIHQVSEATPLPSSNRHRSVRFSHPAVRHVISALHTPLPSSRPVPETLREKDSPANVDFPGQVNLSAIHDRRSNVTNTVLFEELFDQLDGVLAHPRDSKLLRRREEKKRLNDERRRTTIYNSDASTTGKPWPVEGICGTQPANLKTKSGLRALQYLSFHAPIQEEDFSDEAIFGTTDESRSREQHVQATLDLLSRPREEIELSPGPSPTPDVQPSVFDQQTSTRLPYLAFKAPFDSDLPTISELAVNKARGKQSADQSIRHSVEWEKALRTVSQRNSGVASSSASTVPATPDFPSIKTTDPRRRTLLQGTALDLGLSTPAALNPSATPSFPVFNREREQKRRTIIGEQQRDLALTPGFALNAPKPLPRTFSIPRRGVGQAPKPQAISGLPLPSSRPGTGEPQSSSTNTVPESTSQLAAFLARATQADNDERRNSSFASHQSLESEFPIRPKRSRLEKFKKIVTKNY